MIVRGIKIIPLTRHLVQGICANFSGNSRSIDFFIKMCRPFRAWFFSGMITRALRGLSHCGLSALTQAGVFSPSGCRRAMMQLICDSGEQPAQNRIASKSRPEPSPALDRLGRSVKIAA